MAYAITKQESVIVRLDDGTSHLAEEVTAVLDAAGDLAALGTDWAPGSTAIVAETGAEAYMLNASHSWKKI